MKKQLATPVESKSSPPAEPAIIGRAEAFQKVLRMLDRVAPTDRAVLISGPTGSGKEVLAQLIHHRGRGPQTPFQDINCGALPEHLVEAELFGYAKGAFTGAVASHAGHFERVGDGTLFLDEIGELPLALQPKLLRVLETRSFRRLGSAEVKRFNGRIVAASHRNLEASVREGTFREDLYYRLAVFVLEIPGLDQRKEDIPDLVAHFASLQPHPLTFSAEAVARLQSAEWPGHVRQLRSLVDRLGVLAESTLITADTLDAFLPSAPKEHGAPSTDGLADALLALPGDDKLAAAEQLLMDRAMQLSADNKSAAARLLGISRKAVERRMQACETRFQSAQDYLDRANELVRESAFREALPLVERGLELLAFSSKQAPTQRIAFDLHRLSGVCLRALEGWLSQDAVKAYETAFKVGDGLVDEAELSSLLFGIWTTQLMTMDLGKARGTVQDMLQRAQACGLVEQSAEAHVAMANTLFWLGDSAEALACLERGGLTLGSERACHGTQGFDLMGLALNFEGLAAFQTGDFQRAQQARIRLHKRSRELQDHPFDCAIALQGAAWLACLFEDMAELGPLAEELEAMSKQHGFVFYRGVGQILKGVYLTAESRYAEAEEAIREGYETHMLCNGGKLFYSFQAWKMGELLLAAGRPEESDRLMSQAMDVALQHQDRAYLGELLDVQGRARMAMDDFEGAEEALRSAMSTALALGAVPARLRAATHLAELLMRTGRARSAHDLLHKTVGTVDDKQPFPGVHRALNLINKLAA
jgi:DNA-binding NtrC family response regulator/alkylhydroperoxidase/carboxymuconolactone decarboxylase family protein YurZ